MDIIEFGQLAWVIALNTELILSRYDELALVISNWFLVWTSRLLVSWPIVITSSLLVIASWLLVITRLWGMGDGRG